ncbi:MAG TPA: glycerate kinase [Cyclobacteriaceae bacterium]|nr:glycerate kinase [Cyclobacteriaceae bacterium]
MTILIAPDKFKGSLTAAQVCAAVQKGIHGASPDAKIISIPLADGGEGTAELLTRFVGGQMVSIEVLGPDLKPVQAELGFSRDGKTAFIEMAKASGLQLLRPLDRNPLNTSTYGTGQMIRYALDKGVENVVMGIGGSATNDGGAGMAAALGFEFVIPRREKIIPTGKDVGSIKQIKKEGAHPAIQRTKFNILCDVDNPLYGDAGATLVFGPQKGAAGHDIVKLEKGLRIFADVIRRDVGIEPDFPGAGAAGGLGAGAKVFLNATMSRGFEFISDFTKLEERLRTAQLVITGEGKIDIQTLSGKVVKGVAKLAADNNVPCVAIAGACDLPESSLRELGIQQVITVMDNATSQQEAMRSASNIIEKKSATFIKSWLSAI